MELRAYWRIFLRRWWLAAVLTAATAVMSYLYSPLIQGNYIATMRVLLSVPAEQPTGNYFTYDKYYSLLSTEYLTDDFIEVVRSQAFLEDVKKELGATPATPFTIQGQPRTERAPRILTLVITAGNAADAQRVAEAAAKVVATHAKDYFAQLGPSSLAARVIDPPTLSAPTSGSRNYLNIALRTLLGLAVGLALVFLLHYLDTTLYDAEEVVQTTDIQVLAELPPYRDTLPGSAT